MKSVPAPLLIIATVIVGLFFGEEAARGEIFERIRGVLGQEAALAILPARLQKVPSPS